MMELGLTIILIPLCAKQERHVTHHTVVGMHMAPRIQHQQKTTIHIHTKEIEELYALLIQQETHVRPTAEKPLVDQLTDIDSPHQMN